MTPVEIRIALLRKGATVAATARKLALSRNTVSNVIHGYGKSRRVANAVSRITGIPVDTLWPGVYSRDRSRSGGSVTRRPRNTVQKPL